MEWKTVSYLHSIFGTHDCHLGSHFRGQHLYPRFLCPFVHLTSRYHLRNSFMMADRKDPHDLAEQTSIEKACKKCKQRVISAWVKCSKCDDTYHKSCLNVLIDRGKKFCVVSDNVMLCKSHYKDVSNVEGEELKSEIEHLQSKIHQLQTTAGTHKNFTSDDNNQVDIRTTTDKLRDDLECFKKEINKQMNAQFDELRNLLSNNKCRPSNIDSTQKSYSEMLKKPRDAVIFKPKLLKIFKLH
jgi:hypothetical protein